MRGVGAHGRDHPRQVGSSLGGLIRGMATNSAQLSTFDTLGASAALGLQVKRPEVSSEYGCERPLRIAAQPVWSEQGGSSGGARQRSAPRRPLRLRSIELGSDRSCPIRATIAPAAERQSKRPIPYPDRSQSGEAQIPLQDPRSAQRALPPAARLRSRLSAEIDGALRHRPRHVVAWITSAGT